MTATERIRAMLDERGVEWVDTGDGSTLIPAQAATNVAWDVNTWPSGKDMGDCLWVQNRHPLTPEQAIEATLGGVPYSKPAMLSDLQAENAKLRELAENLLMAFVVLETPKEQQKCIDRAIELRHELNVLPMETFDAGELGVEV